MENQTRLEQLNSAISQIESGAQEYSIGSRKVRKADLALLYKERDRIEEQIRANNGFDGCVVSNYFSR
ncbi:MAG: hypothetical protein RR444_09755 [Oscillospiraceae bacterium]